VRLRGSADEIQLGNQFVEAQPGANDKYAWHVSATRKVLVKVNGHRGAGLRHQNETVEIAPAQNLWV
jgi:hypothetical protein